MKTDNTDRTFEKILSHRLAEAEIAPPADMWSRIENKRKTTRRFILLRIAAAALLLLGSAFLINLMINESPLEILSNNDIITEADSKPLQEQIQSNAAKQHNEYNGSAQMIARAEVNEVQAETVIIKVEPITEIAASNITYPDAHSDNDGNIDSAKGEDPEVKKVPIKTNIPLLPDNVEELAPKDKNRDQRWSIGLAYGSNIDRGPAAVTGPQRLSNSSFGFDEFQGELAFETVYFQQIENTSFEPPFSVGALVNMPLSSRFRLETGLFYTLLAHESRTLLINNKQSVFSTRLHYLGIPVGIQWVIINGRAIRLYLSLSLVIEKGLRADYTADRFEKGRFLETEQSQIEIRGVQLSGNTSIGIEFSLPQNLALFGQAGAQIFLMNKTQPFNLRSEHMIWPAVQTGIRWRILD